MISLILGRINLKDCVHLTGLSICRSPQPFQLEKIYCTQVQWENLSTVKDLTIKIFNDEPWEDDILYTIVYVVDRLFYNPVLRRCKTAAVCRKRKNPTTEKHKDQFSPRRLRFSHCSHLMTF